MSAKDTIEENSEKTLLPIIEENKLELVDVEYVKEGANWYLRAYIDKEGGINIQDCELVSRAWEAKLDEEDFIKTPYILEVSSPGLDRQLKKEKDFIRSIGKKVEIKLYRAADKQKNLVGELLEYSKEMITIKLENNETKEILIKDIANIRLFVEF